MRRVSKAVPHRQPQHRPGQSPSRVPRRIIPRRGALLLPDRTRLAVVQPPIARADVGLACAQREDARRDAGHVAGGRGRGHAHAAPRDPAALERAEGTGDAVPVSTARQQQALRDDYLAQHVGVVRRRVRRQGVGACDAPVRRRRRREHRGRPGIGRQDGHKIARGRH